MINEKLLLENGYKEYEVNKNFHPYANRFFQKRFRNEKGQTKYFISVFEYLHEDYTLNYEVGLQFEKERYVMNIHIFAISENMTIKEIEKEVYKIWYELDCKYYDSEAE